MQKENVLTLATRYSNAASVADHVDGIAEVAAAVRDMLVNLNDCAHSLGIPVPSNVVDTIENIDELRDSLITVRNRAHNVASDARKAIAEIGKIDAQAFINSLTPADIVQLIKDRG